MHNTQDVSRRRSENMRQVNQAQKERTMFLARNAIQEMVEDRERITFAAIARRSGVSASVLYQREDLRAEIIAAREAQRSNFSLKAAKEGRADASEAKRVIESLEAEVKRLRKENERLRIFASELDFCI